jgi:outer membrane protein assembly factor BamB
VIPPDELAENGEVILNAAPWVISYDLASGEELWRAERLAGEVVPAPMLAGELVIAMHADFGISAIRRGGRGDVGESHLAWSHDYGAPGISSPALHDGQLYVLEDDGYITCYDTADGAKVWEHEVDGYFNASPSIIGDRLYATNSEGLTYVLKVGREFEAVAQNELGEKVGASFAFGGDRIYLRGEQHLFAIGAAAR